MMNQNISNNIVPGELIFVFFKLFDPPLKSNHSRENSMPIEYKETFSFLCYRYSDVCNYTYIPGVDISTSSCARKFSERHLKAQRTVWFFEKWSISPTMYSSSSGKMRNGHWLPENYHRCYRFPPF